MAEEGNTCRKRPRKAIVGEIQELEVRLPEGEVQEVERVGDAIVLETEYSKTRKES